MKRWRPPNPEWQVRADQVIAQGCLTNSKHPRSHVRGVYPTHLLKGEGCRVIDADGNLYLDFICGLGSSLFGFAHTEISAAVMSQIHKGSALSFATTLEVEVAEKLIQAFPWCQSVKFLKTGSEACSAAIKIARAATGRKLVISEGYHGWHDDFVSLSPPALGVPKRDWIRKLEKTEYPPDEVAAVIVEAVTLDTSDEYFNWLRELRENCTRTGTMLIFDEVITGFRFPGMSVAKFSGIEPDLICIGKAMGGGLPISAVMGKHAVMNCDEYFVSSTFAGDTLALAACKKTIEMLQGKYRLEDLWERGLNFQKRFNALWPEGVTIKGYPTRGVFEGNEMTKALFFQEACKAGILFGPSFFYNFSHMTINDQVIASCDDILMRIKQGNVRLEGEMPKKPFAQAVREQK